MEGILLETQLLEKAKKERVEESYELIERICKRYLRGIGIDDDTRIELHNDAVQAIKDILEPFGLCCVINTNNYQTFLDEYNSWKNGVPLTEEFGNEWLFYNICKDKSIENTIDKENKSIPAPHYAKELYFKVLDEYRIPIEYYMPCPENVPNPHAKCTHSYADGHRFLIRFECVNNDNFFADQNPTGKNYILVNEYGLKADITIDRVYKQGDKIPFRNYFIEKTPGSMSVTGTIEGYTTEKKRSFEIEKIGSHGIWIYLTMGWDDASTYLNFPLWKKHFEWYRQQDDMLINCRYQCFEEVYQKKYENYIGNDGSAKKHTVE